MALVSDQKFSTFANGGNAAVGDTLVGLRDGINTKFNYNGLPDNYVVPIDQGGTGATTAEGARDNLGLGSMAVQNADAVAITGGTAALTSGSVTDAPVADTDIANKIYVDNAVDGTVTSITGTANQVIASSATGDVTLSLPQDVSSTSSPTFDGITLTQGTISSTPTSASDIVNKSYVDGLDSGNVKSVTGTADEVTVDNTDPQNPVLSLPSTLNAPGTLAVQGTVAIDAIIDDDTFDTATATNVPTAGSVKAYVNVQSSSYGTVSPGLSNQLAYYATSGDTVSGLTTMADAVLVTSPTGQPMISPTLPDGLDLGMPMALFLNNALNLPIAGISATGTPGSTTFLCGNGSWAVPSNGITPSALTSSNDTNVTITLGGTPATSLLQSVSLTMGWSGTLGVGRGGLGLSSTPSNGQIPIGNGSGYTLTTLTAGSGISISNGSGSITISGTGSGIGWTEVTGTSQTMTPDSGWVANNASLVTLTLPTTAAFGTAISVIGKGAGGWKIAQNAGQNIQLGIFSSTVGTGGSVSSTNQYDSITLICITANTTWAALGSPQGNITYT